VLFAGLTLDLDPTYFFVLALILLPFAALNAFVFRPFLKLFEARHERIVGAMERAARKLDEAEAKAHAFEKKIQQATKQGMEARDRIRGTAAEAMKKRIDEERAKLAKNTESALGEIDAARRSSLAAVEADARRLAELTATKLLGRGV
jgi:F0F1-type ATP synthase membrane subunit b/b'